METGKDGRFYDWHYDYNHNGQLEMNEYMDYEDVTFGHHDNGGGGRRSMSNARGILLGLGLMIRVPLLFAICPLFGLILLVILITL